MVTVLDRLGAPPPAEAAETAEYACDCEGFKTLNVMRMCLRCLNAYSEGLPHVVSGKRLEAEMRRVAIRLRMLIKDDPSLGRIPVRAG